MEDKCDICGGIKFPVYFEDKTVYRCINCQRTIQEVLLANGYAIKE